MSLDSKPNFGFLQPTVGRDYVSDSFSMGERAAKRGRWSGSLRAIFVDNLNQALNARYPDSRNKASALERDSGVSDENINRWLRGAGAPRLDQLERIAIALRVRPYELLKPGLEVAERPKVPPTRPPRGRPSNTPTPQPSTNT